MYQPIARDIQLLKERAQQLAGQIARQREGRLTEDELRPLRLQNGLYIQRHAPMLRVAIAYGMLNSAQLRALAAVARRYDRGWGHFTTRQNLQLNWISVDDTPRALADLAEVGLGRELDAAGGQRFEIRERLVDDGCHVGGILGSVCRLPPARRGFDRRAAAALGAP